MFPAEKAEKVEKVEKAEKAEKVEKVEKVEKEQEDRGYTLESMISLCEKVESCKLELMPET